MQYHDSNFRHLICRKHSKLAGSGSIEICLLYLAEEFLPKEGEESDDDTLQFELTCQTVHWS